MLADMFDAIITMGTRPTYPGTGCTFSEARAIFTSLADPENSTNGALTAEPLSTVTPPTDVNDKFAVPTGTLNDTVKVTLRQLDAANEMPGTILAVPANVIKAGESGGGINRAGTEVVTTLS